MKRIFNRGIKDTIKKVLQYLIFIFFVVYISVAIIGKGEHNSLKIALYVTSFFGGLAFSCLYIYTIRLLNRKKCANN